MPAPLPRQLFVLQSSTPPRGGLRPPLSGHFAAAGHSVASGGRRKRPLPAATASRCRRQRSTPSTESTESSRTAGPRPPPGGGSSTFNPPVQYARPHPPRSLPTGCLCWVEETRPTYQLAGGCLCFRRPPSRSETPFVDQFSILLHKSGLRFHVRSLLLGTRVGGPRMPTRDLQVDQTCHSLSAPSHLGFGESGLRGACTAVERIWHTPDRGQKRVTPIRSLAEGVCACV